MIERKYESDLSPFKWPTALEHCLSLDEVIFLDIETTGFDRVKSQITVIGLMTLTASSCIIYQLFCERRSDEKVVLKRLSELLTGRRCLLTFNGNGFDIPYLNSKYHQNAITSPLNHLVSLDLYELAKLIYQGHKGLKLKDIERYLHIERTDLVSGKEVVDLYYEYLRSRDLRAVEQILLHNYDDVLNMKGLLQLLDMIPEQFSKLITPMKLCDTHAILIYRASVVGDFLEAKLLLPKASIDPHIPHTSVDSKGPQTIITPISSHDVSSGQLHLRIPLIRFNNALVTDTMSIFNQPLSNFGEDASNFILALDEILLMDNIRSTLCYVLKHQKPSII